MSKAYKVIGNQADYEAWKKARYEGISASFIASLLSLNKYDKRTVGQVINDFAHRVDNYTDSPSAEAGRRLERPILDWAQDIHGQPIVSWQDLLQSVEYPWIIATPDGYTTNSLGATVLVECKTHSVYTTKDWKLGVPDAYIVQVQTQMLVTGYRSAMVVEWCYGSLPAFHHVGWDQDVIDMIVAKTRDAWSQVVAIRKEAGIS